MPSSAPRRKPRPRTSTPGQAEAPRAPAGGSGLGARLQILAGFLLPLVVLGIWLQSRGFFGGF